MGSVAATASIERVLALHEQELIEEVHEELPPSIRALKPTVSLENESHRLARWIAWTNGHAEEWLELRPLSIDELADRFPEARVSW